MAEDQAWVPASDRSRAVALRRSDRGGGFGQGDITRAALFPGMK
jgi:hypothetical protein